MRRDIVEEYETVCLSAGGHAGVVDLASFSVVNAVLAGGGANAEDWLLVHVAHGYSTIVIVRRGRIILYRNRQAEGDDDLGDLVHQTKMYYEDRLGGGVFWRIFLAVSAANTEAEDADTLRRLLEARLGGRAALIRGVDPLEVSMGRVRADASDAASSDVLPLVPLIHYLIHLLHRCYTPLTPPQVKMNRALYDRRDVRSLRDELLDARARHAHAAVELLAPDAQAQLLIREMIEDSPSVVAHSVHRRILTKAGLLFVVRVDRDAPAAGRTGGASPQPVSISPELASRASLVW